MADKKIDTTKPAPSELKDKDLDKVAGGAQVAGGDKTKEK